ncbi:MAG: B12-binding domain-containing radical SAM protein [Candidatus Gastranaerophilales bacterium]|nr:B12-binding domain-containing radical SAM protein [Candidatus Gastranaerophilales bacterium]
MSETYLYNRTLNKNTDYNVWFAFPECYSFAMSSLGFLLIYKELDEMENIFAERICMDTAKTKIKPQDVDAICFSFTFDMDFINIFKILDKYNIPIKSKDRKNAPFVFAGGTVLTANPEPFKDIFDFMIIGDGEGINSSAVQICRENRNRAKEEVLELLSKVGGVYVPYIHSCQNPVKKGHSDLKQCVYTPILSDKSFFKNTFIIETSRGCYNRCGFCVASYLNLPARFVEYETIIEKIEFGLKYTNKIALLGALVSAHPNFKDICAYIYNKIQSGEDIEMNISSLRADTITPDVVRMLTAAGQKNITLAIESASQRLRKVINKNISEEQLFAAIKTAKEYGLKGVKIYTMLGLPTETQEDIEEFIRLAVDLKNEFRGFDITFSFSTFVPKPHTPFQWCTRESTKSLEKKEEYLKKELHKIGMNAKFSSAKWDYYQTLVSRGDVSLTDYLIEVYRLGGKLGAYKTCAKKLGINTDKFVTEPLNMEKELPWNVIDISPGVQILKNEFNRLMNKS